MITRTDPLGRTSYLYYNGFDELTQSISPEGANHTYDYNATGDLVSATDGVGATTSYAYGDAAHPGEVTSVTDPDGRVSTVAHDGFGDLASQSLSPSSGVTRTAEYVYDGDGELLCTAPPAAVAAGAHCPAAGGAASRAPSASTTTPGPAPPDDRRHRRHHDLHLRRGRRPHRRHRP